MGYLVFHEEDPVLGILSASKIERKTPEVRRVAAPGSMLMWGLMWMEQQLQNLSSGSGHRASSEYFRSEIGPPLKLE